VGLLKTEPQAQLSIAHLSLKELGRKSSESQMNVNITRDFRLPPRSSAWSRHSPWTAMGPTGYPETFISNYQTTPPNIPEEQKPQRRYQSDNEV
jgi:hypothetical protein